ncbi:CLUMA_CG011801, isoform A [Clunio marinus]|uniref:CLUMA_CG011801, isoform A n=1 Tax=Clunio marinus TaxID=568069 RepID=A0A1J1IFZ0_9DIPT|nr:CLUMA_CG011801, isoform A [Clunio marinus]
MCKFSIFFVAFCTLLRVQIIEANKICITTAPTDAPTQALSAYWVQVTGSPEEIPEGALVGGYINDYPSYGDNDKNYNVCRGFRGGALTPGKYGAFYVTAYDACTIGWGGEEFHTYEFEILVGSGNWVSSSGSNIPPNAVPGGESEDGEVLYVCRVNHSGSVIVGKFHPSYSNCFITYHGYESSFYNFEVLTYL